MTDGIRINQRFLLTPRRFLNEMMAMSFSGRYFHVNSICCSLYVLCIKVLCSCITSPKRVVFPVLTRPRVRLTFLAPYDRFGIQSGRCSHNCLRTWFYRKTTTVEASGQRLFVSYHPSRNYLCQEFRNQIASDVLVKLKINIWVLICTLNYKVVLRAVWKRTERTEVIFDLSVVHIREIILNSILAF